MFFLKKLFKIREEAARKRWEDTEKPFLDHLDDLRTMLMKIIITLLIATVVTFVFNKQLLEIIKYPMAQSGIPESAAKVTGVFSPVEGFTSIIKICLYAAIVLTFPFLLYFIGEFVLPGLTDRERKMVLPSLTVGFTLFLIGVFFSYFVVIPRALEFFYWFSVNRGIEFDLRLRYYVSFVTQLTLVFGLCFQLPVVVMALVKLDLLSHRLMSDTRSYAIIIMFVVAAIITPTTDVFTLCLLAGPMIVLYEICIWLAWGLERKRERAEQAEKARDAERARERARRQLEDDKSKSAADEAEEKPAEPDTSASTEGSSSGSPVPEAREDTQEFSYSPDNAVEHTDGDTSEEASVESQDSDVDEHHDHAAEEATDSDSTWHDDHHGHDPHHDDPHHYDHDHYHDHDHDHYHDDYYSGPTEELKRTLREELKDELKGEIKAELRDELLVELRKELGISLGSAESDRSGGDDSSNGQSAAES